MTLLETISGWLTRPAIRHLEQRMGALERKEAMDVAALDNKLNAIGADLAEASEEITTELTSLRDQIANGGIPTELMAKIDSIAERAAALKDIIPGSPTPVDPAQ